MLHSWCSRCHQILGYIYDDLAALAKPAPYLLAEFQIGDKASNQPEYSLTMSARKRIDGSLTWDPSHDEARSPLFSVACVRLEVSPTLARWSVGTSRFIKSKQAAPGYAKITEVWVAASLGKSDPPPAQRMIQWNSLDLALIGNADVCLHRPALSSPLLPGCIFMGSANIRRISWIGSIPLYWTT